LNSSRTGPFSLIREFFNYGNCIKSIRPYQETGILEIVLSGQVVITPQFVEGMRNSGYILQSISNSIDPEYIDSGSLGDYEINEIEKEDDVPYFICTTLRFEDTELPPLENSKKSDTEALRMEPLKTELVAAGFETACSGCGCDLDTEDDQGDDMSP
jgi:hypothetical protein